MHVSIVLPVVLSAVFAAGPLAERVEEAPLTIDVTPSVIMSPGTVRLVAMVARHPENVRVELAADSGSYFRSSTIELDGAEAPRTHVMLFKRLPAGDYKVSALLTRSDGSEILHEVDLMVIGERRH